MLQEIKDDVNEIIADMKSDKTFRTKIFIILGVVLGALYFFVYSPIEKKLSRAQTSARNLRSKVKQRYTKWRKR